MQINLGSLDKAGLCLQVRRYHFQQFLPQSYILFLAKCLHIHPKSVQPVPVLYLHPCTLKYKPLWYNHFVQYILFALFPHCQGLLQSFPQKLFSLQGLIRLHILHYSQFHPKTVGAGLLYWGIPS